MTRATHDAPPAFSVLMANFNNGPFVAEAIESVLSQTIEGWELVIVDDSSQDDSLDVIDAYLSDPRIRLVVQADNRGYISTLQHLIALARADIVGILDSDDALFPNALELVLAAYEQDPGRGFVYTNYALCDASLNRIGPGLSRRIPPAMSAAHDHYVSAFRTFRRSVYYATAGYDPRVLYAEDQDIAFKLEELVRPHFIPAETYRYRVLDDSQSHAPAKRRRGMDSKANARYQAFLRRTWSPSVAPRPPASVVAAGLLSSAVTMAKEQQWGLVGPNAVRAIHVLWLERPDWAAVTSYAEDRQKKAKRRVIRYLADDARPRWVKPALSLSRRLVRRARKLVRPVKKKSTPIRVAPQVFIVNAGDPHLTTLAKPGDSQPITTARKTEDAATVVLRPGAPAATLLESSLIERLRARHHIRLRLDQCQPSEAARVIVKLAVAGVPLVVEQAPESLRDTLTAPVMDGLLRPPADVTARDRRIAQTRTAVHFAHASAVDPDRRPQAGLAAIDWPLVSVVLVTRRPAFLGHALEQVAAQSYPNLELIVALHGDGFDTGIEGVAGLERRTVIRVGSEVVFGQALNIASELTSGSLLTKMDDDDWYDHAHISDLVVAWMMSGADLVGKPTEFVYTRDVDKTVRRRSRVHETCGGAIAGGTFLFPRNTLRRAGGWRPVARHVDKHLIDEIKRYGGSIFKTHGFGYILQRHGDHTWGVKSDELLKGATEAPRSGVALEYAGVRRRSDRTARPEQGK